MMTMEDLPPALGPALFLHAYDRILDGGECQTPQQALKSIVIFNCVIYRQARGEVVNNALLQEIFSMSKTTTWRILNMLKDRNLIELEEVDVNITKMHAVRAPEPIVEYVRDAIERIGPTDDRGFFKDSSELIALINNANMTILHSKTDQVTASHIMTTMGLYLVIAGLNAETEIVTRPVLKKKLGMSENSYRSKVDYLNKLGLVKVTEGKTENNIAREYRIQVQSSVIEAVRKAEAIRAENFALLNATVSDEGF